MSSFTDGMRMGQMAAQMAIDNRRRDVQDQRDAEEFDWRRADHDEQQATKNAVKGELGRLDSGLTLTADQPVAPAPGLSLGLPVPAAPRTSYVGDVSAGAGLTLGSGSVDQAIGAAPTGPIPEQGGALGRTPTASEREAVYGRVAQLQGDIAGMRTADTNRRTFEFKEQFGKHLSEYQDDADHVNEGIKYLNKTDGIVTIAKPDKRGFSQISYVKDDGEAGFSRLSQAERAQIWAASQMMGSHPEESLAVIRGINKDLGDAAAKSAATTLGVAKTNNDAAYHRGMLDNDAAKTSAMVAHYRGLTDRSKQYMIENDAGERGVFTPKAFDKNGNAILPQGFRFVLEDGQGRGRAAAAGLDLKVNPDGSVIKGGKMYYPTGPGQYKEVSGLGPTTLDTALEAFTKNGGVAGPKPGEAYIGAPTPGFRPMTQSDMRAASQPAVNPDNLERVSKRGLFGGVTYAYRDPATGREFSVDEYNKMFSD